MEDKPNPYDAWIEEVPNTGPKIAPAASLVAPASAARGYRVLGSILLGMVLVGGLVFYAWHKVGQARVQETRLGHARMEAAMLAAGQAARRAADEAAALMELARQQAKGKGDPVRDREELTVMRAALARAVAGAGAAQESARLAAGTAPAAEAELSVRNGREAAEAALVRVRADVAEIHAALAAISRREEAARQAQAGAQQEAQEQERAAVRRQETETLAQSVNHALVQPAGGFVVLLDDNQQPAWEAMDELAKRLRAAGHPVESRLLTPVFFSTPLARELVEHGPAGVLPKLGLEARRVIVGRIRLRAEPPDKFGAIATDCTGMLTVFDPAGTALGSVRWSGAGAAFDGAGSAAQAQARSWIRMDWSQLGSLLAP